MTTLMQRMQHELDWPDWFMRRWGDWPETWHDLMETAALKVEEYEDEGELVVRAEMPGIDPDRDVEITISDRRLHLHAERRTEETTETKKGYRSEFRYGSFDRTVPLPTGATEQDVTASYTDGILEVRIPIDTAELEARKVPVERK